MYVAVSPCLEYISLYIFIYFSDIHNTMSSQKWLTSHSKYKNTSAGVDDSVARQARDVRSTPTQCWPNVYDVEPTTEPAPTKHPCLTGQAAQFYITIHTEVGPSNDHQLSVNDLINLFTYFNDDDYVNFNKYNNYNNYKHCCHKCMISISKQHE